MKFELKRYNRNISESDILTDLKDVADRLCKQTITIEEYDKLGKYAPTTLRRKFNLGWDDILALAGLRQANRNDYSKISDAELIEDLKKISKSLNKLYISHDEYNQYGKFRYEIYLKRFKRWHKALECAGLKYKQARSMSDEELFENIINVWQKLGRQPFYKDMCQPLSKYSGKPYVETIAQE